MNNPTFRNFHKEYLSRPKDARGELMFTNEWKQPVTWKEANKTMLKYQSIKKKLREMGFSIVY